MTPSKKSHQTKTAPSSRDVPIDTEQLNQHLVNEFIPLIATSSYPPEQEEFQLRVYQAIRLYEELDPQDGIESMLARQMIGIQNAQHGCLYKAMHPEQSLKAQVAYLDKAARLS